VAVLRPLNCAQVNSLLDHFPKWRHLPQPSHMLHQQIQDKIDLFDSCEPGPRARESRNANKILVTLWKKQNKTKQKNKKQSIKASRSSHTISKDYGTKWSSPANSEPKRAMGQLIVHPQRPQHVTRLQTSACAGAATTNSYIFQCHQQ